jgi:siroheme synthase-like protein
MPAEPRPYPVQLELAGRSCLVVGGGNVALRKARGLLDAGARVTVIAPEIADELAVLAATVERRSYAPGDIAGHRLVIAATDDAAVNHQVFLDGEALGIWVNSADDPANCSFTLPAVARQGPITVTVATGGHSPAFAAWLRDQVAAELGPAHETLLQLLAERREALRSEGIPTEGLPWREALDSGMLDLVRAGRVAEARERLQACL